MKAFCDVVGVWGAHASFRFDADGQAALWSMKDEYCDNPHCAGGEVEVILLDDGNPPRRIEFGIHLTKRKAHWDGDLSHLDQAVVQEFADDPGRQRMLVRRRSLVRAWALSRLHDGPPVNREEDRCYGLLDFDLAGDDHALPFDLAGTGWCAIDLYCVNPACTCEEALLSFFEDGPDAAELLESFTARLDLRGAGATDVSGVPLSRDRARVVAGLQAELGTWEAELGLRRQLVRRIAARRLESDDPAPTVKGHETARNDPCPCGSGRKFKRCCGALGGPGAAGSSLR